VLVVVNAGDRPVEVDIDVPELAGSALHDQPLPGGTDVPVDIGGAGHATIAVPPRRGRLLIPASG
jgi:hypothetical protein